MSPFVFLVIGVLMQQFAEESEAIVGGQPAAPGEFPYQVSLRYRGSHFCGGSIIAPTKILTTANCVYDQTPSTFQIATGTNNIKEGQLHKVAYFIIHPKYIPLYEGNNIAVITLAAPITYSNVQRPIPLATHRPAVGTSCILTGWGSNNELGNLQDTLQKINEIVIPQEKCPTRNFNIILLDASNLCAFNRYGSGACQGDGGGPLVCNGTQVGILAWGIGCAKYPDVYTDVSYYRDFIDQV